MRIGIDDSESGYYTEAERALSHARRAASVMIPTSVKDQELVSARRAQIVRAAVQLFSSKGFHKTTTREIAKASGLSNGALYEYVKTKEDVLFLVCRHIHQEIHRRLQDREPKTGLGAVQLRGAISAFFDAMDAMQADVLLIYQESKSLPQPFLRDVLAEEQRIANIFEQLLWLGIEDASLSAASNAISLLAHNIVVAGQMWAFRRWAMRDVQFEQFKALQTDVLMQACGDASSSRLHWKDGQP